ncbi:general transcription factor IIIC polypeptide 3 GTF3C3, partial [Cardiosporidium cionae]
SWAIRQLLQRPYSFCLIVIVSHFCLLSSRWPFAVAEYIRAHRLLPHDDLICLSLAAAYINFSTSRSVQNRHAVVLRGFTMLNRYLTLRLHSAHMQFIPPHRKTFLEAENAYNLARAYHQLSLFYLSIPLYLKSLQILDTLRDFEKTLESFPVVELTTEAQRGAFVRSLLMDIRQLTL